MGTLSPQPIKILIADDNDCVRDLLRDFLSDKSEFVAVAQSGEEAVALMEKMPFDLAFVDYTMPGIDGIQTSRLLREISPQAEVVLISGYLETKTENSLAAEGLSLLQKPFSLNDIAALVAACSARKDSQTLKGHIGLDLHAKVE